MITSHILAMLGGALIGAGLAGWLGDALAARRRRRLDRQSAGFSHPPVNGWQPREMPRLPAGPIYNPLSKGRR